jgi:hypothetical protein
MLSFRDVPSSQQRPRQAASPRGASAARAPARAGLPAALFLPVISAVLAVLSSAAPSAAEGAGPDAGAPRERRDGDAGAGPAARFDGTVRPPALEDVEHMCALLTGCPRLPLPAGFVPRDLPGCVRALADELASPRAAAFSLTLRECGLRASSCGELRTCALRGARADVCAGRGKASPVDLCDEGGRAITCSGERPVLVRDCPRGGEQCVVVGGKATCALGACEADAPPACSASGTRVVECRKGKLVSSDCSALGLRCAVAGGEGRVPQCVPATAACADASATCDGDTSVGCYRGREVRVDCGARGLACASGAGDGHAPPASTMGACEVPVPTEGACDAKVPARCDGATLKWCAFGAPRSYLCKAMGFTRCASDEKGARCVP